MGMYGGPYEFTRDQPSARRGGPDGSRNARHIERDSLSASYGRGHPVRYD
jgi:hypothetical protein